MPWFQLPLSGGPTKITGKHGPMPRQLGSSRCSLVAPRHPQRLGEIGIPSTSIHCNPAGTMAYLEVDRRHISPNSHCMSLGKIQYSKWDQLCPGTSSIDSFVLKLQSQLPKQLHLDIVIPATVGTQTRWGTNKNQRGDPAQLIPWPPKVQCRWPVLQAWNNT